MSKNTHNKILAKLARLDEYLRYLRQIQKASKAKFLNDFFVFGAAERYLQLAVEILLDIGKLLIVSQGLRRPESNQEIFEVLAEKRVISAPLLKRLTGIANFRNILVHDYEKINRGIIYQKVQKNLRDFVDFKKQVLKFLKRK